MTTKEQKTIGDLYKLVDSLAKGSLDLKKSVEDRVQKVERQVGATYLPCNLEQEVLRTAQQSISEAIKASLTGYSSPLTKFVTAVVEENGAYLKGIISDAFSQAIRKEDFKKSIVDAFSHKIARSIISNNDGLFDKVGNELKQDTIFRSKMAIAIANVVEECLNKK